MADKRKLKSRCCLTSQLVPLVDGGNVVVRGVFNRDDGKWWPFGLVPDRCYEPELPEPPEGFRWLLDGTGKRVDRFPKKGDGYLDGRGHVQIADFDWETCTHYILERIQPEPPTPKFPVGSYIVLRDTTILRRVISRQQYTEHCVHCVAPASDDWVFGITSSGTGTSGRADEYTAWKPAKGERVWSTQWNCYAVIHLEPAAPEWSACYVLRFDDGRQVHVHLSNLAPAEFFPEKPEPKFAVGDWAKGPAGGVFCIAEVGDRGAYGTFPTGAPTGIYPVAKLESASASDIGAYVRRLGYTDCEIGRFIREAFAAREKP